MKGCNTDAATVTAHSGEGLPDALLKSPYSRGKSEGFGGFTVRNLPLQNPNPTLSLPVGSTTSERKAGVVKQQVGHVLPVPVMFCLRMLGT